MAEPTPEIRFEGLWSGVFVLLTVALLIAGALWLSGRTLGGVPYDLIADASVAGLGRGAVVRLRGVDVGRVERVDFDPQDPRRVRVRIAVDRSVPLMADVHATLSYLGVSGAAYVELDYASDSRQALASSAAAPARIPLQPSWLSQLSGSADGFLRRLTSTLDRADAVLDERNVEHLSRLLVQLEAATVQVTALTTGLHPASKRIDGLLADVDQAARLAGPILRNFDGLTADVRARIGVLDELRASMHDTGQAVRGMERALVRDTLPRVDRLAQQLRRDADTLDQLLRELKDQPQSLILGAAPARPGPGEPGFQSPSVSRR